MQQSLTTDEWLVVIGEHVRASRLEFEGGMSREDLAHLAGVSISALAKQALQRAAIKDVSRRISTAAERASWSACGAWLGLDREGIEG